ncbi:MAG: ParB N-terminal domain-containing protein [Planctomycetes bacterium]|nr:ParB N-terminal domain-containing protein [Planctomycetota bacterium]
MTRPPLSIDADSPAAERFRYTRTPAPDALRASIEAAGVLCPVVAVREGDAVVLVTGFRRVLVARELGLSSVPVRLLDSDAEAREAFRLGLWENIAHRRFHAVEIAAILARLGGILGAGDAEIEAAWLRPLGIPSPGMLRLYRRIEELDPDVRDALARDAIDVRHAEILLEIDPPDRRAFFEGVIRRGRATVGDARRAWRSTRDIALRERRGVRSILAEAGGSEGEGRPWLDGLIARLRIRAAPAIAAAEARFALEVRGLGLPGGVRVDPPPAFEGDGIRFCFVAPDAGAYARFARALADPATIEGASALWRILREGA